MNRTARLAGALYLSLAFFGFFSFVYVPSSLLVRGDAAATAHNIAESELLFRAGSVSHLVSQIVVAFLALTMYRLFRPVNGRRAALMAVLALLCVAVSFASEIPSFVVAGLVGGDEVAAAPSRLAAETTLLLDMSRSGVLLAQVFWGLWSLPLAALVFRSGFLPRLLALPVAIAGIGYLVDSGTQLLLPGTATISQFTALAEVPLPLWLLIRGCGSSAGGRPRPHR